MKQALITTVMVLALAATAGAEIDTLADTTMMVSDIYRFKVVEDNYIVAVTQHGVSSFALNQSTSRFSFRDIVTLDLDSPIIRVCDNLVVVAESDGTFHFFDVESLPRLDYLGANELGVSISDFALTGQHLYVSTWFDGIWRYSLDPGSGPQFLDSSMIGIYVTQMEISGDSLYALDEYNGILYYDLSQGGFGEFMGYLYVPRRAHQFGIYGSQFYLALEDGFYEADFAGSEPAIVDSVIGLEYPHNLYVTNSQVILVLDSDLLLLERNDFNIQTLLHTPNNRMWGDLLELNEDMRLLMAEEDGGLTMFNLDLGAVRSSGLDREGQITGLLAYSDKLFVTGWSMPVHVYDIADQTVNYGYAIYADWDSTALMLHNGDTLFTLSALTNTLNFFVNSTDPDGVYLDNAFYAAANSSRKVLYLDERVNGYRVMLVLKSQSIDVWRISDEAEISLAATWLLVGDEIRHMVAKGSTVYLEGYKTPQLRAFGFNAFFQPVPLGGVGLAGHPLHMTVFGDYLYAFQYYLVQPVDITDPASPDLQPATSLPFPIYDAQPYGSHLFGVGPDGVAVFSVDASGMLVLSAEGGRGGQRLAVGSEILAVDCGDGVNIYKIDTTEIPTWVPVDSLMPGRFLLTQNYPNPFNLETTISYSLGRKAAVDLSVFNVLGQKVATLVQTTQPPGTYTVQWDGTTVSGDIAATGVYFYRLTADELRQTRKMVILK